MKDEVKKLLTGEEEQRLWEEIYDAFQKGGLEKVKSLLEEKAKSIENEFNAQIAKIDEKLGGSL
ncbi:MAG: hypothetical protein ACK4TF_02320 [Thermodesulfovibrionales bacterium]